MVSRWVQCRWDLGCVKLEVKPFGIKPLSVVSVLCEDLREFQEHFSTVSLLETLRCTVPAWCGDRTWQWPMVPPIVSPDKWSWREAWSIASVAAEDKLQWPSGSLVLGQCRGMRHLSAHQTSLEWIQGRQKQLCYTPITCKWNLIKQRMEAMLFTWFNLSKWSRHSSSMLFKTNQHLILIFPLFFTTLRYLPLRYSIPDPEFWQFLRSHSFPTLLTPWRH